MGTPMDLNRAHWDEATDIHARGNVYGIDDFKAGRCQLHRIEVEELGDVAGKRLLHLQCHFGLGTLSWARRGAIVTGVDFSPKAIALARSLATEAGIDARFVESNVYDLPAALSGRFDVVFCSFGDMLRVPGSREDLLSVKARGGDVRIVYSPLDALKIARQHPDRRVVFFAVGFETTAPANAMAIQRAAASASTTSP